MDGPDNVFLQMLLSWYVISYWLLPFQHFRRNRSSHIPTLLFIAIRKTLKNYRNVVCRRIDKFLKSIFLIFGMFYKTVNVVEFFKSWIFGLTMFTHDTQGFRNEWHRYNLRKASLRSHNLKLYCKLLFLNFNNCFIFITFKCIIVSGAGSNPKRIDQHWKFPSKEKTSPLDQGICIGTGRIVVAFGGQYFCRHPSRGHLILWKQSHVGFFIIYRHSGREHLDSYVDLQHQLGDY